MKTNLYLKVILFLAALVLTVSGSLAQEKKTGKVSLKIEEDGKTTVDTVFELRKGQDPEQLTKVISQLAGEDVLVFTHKTDEHDIMVMNIDDDGHVWHMAHPGQDSATTKHVEKKIMVMMGGEGDSLSHKCKTLDIGIDIDSLRAAHGCAKVMVIKDEEGDIVTKVFDEEIEWVSEDKECDHAGKTYKIIITDEEQSEGTEEVYVLKTDNDKQVKVISGKSVVITSGGDDEDENQVKVIVIGDDEDEHATKNMKVTVKVLDEDEDKEADGDKAEKQEKKRKDK
jgi:hypothetical protein